MLASAASPAWASYSVDLPELLGDYSYSEFTTGLVTNRTAIIETLFRTDQVQTAVLYLSGTISPGSVRGDGIQREATTVPRQSAFSFSLAIGDHVFLGLIPAGGAPFIEQREYTGPFNAVVIMPGEQYPFVAQIHFGLGHNGFSPDELPRWLIPPPDWPNPTLWLKDLEFVTPNRHDHRSPPGFRRPRPAGAGDADAGGAGCRGHAAPAQAAVIERGVDWAMR